MLLGICGKAGSGKDTIADHVVSCYGFQKISLADPIKRLVKDVFVLDNDTVYDRVKREELLINWPGWSVRKLLQYIGTELFRNNIDSEIWVKSLWFRILANPDVNYVCPDIRFPNEYDYFKSNAKNDNFLSIKVVRPGCDGTVGLVGHESEKYDLKADFTIQNIGTCQELYHHVDGILKARGVI